ncbi:SRPBCC family protein [Nitrosomonas halophila]|uniref:Polyketide cyclase / dehydrase and lipid transport n=1 Tax=Nitrosomonas halophila TaxID=44576 RepID=A0A1H3FZM0_9PROT|nr:SRPBCC family protein [Nitrosomonas halophila]SDX96426.1 Polyketide cyclase / dehydrase and lipid transport [Nitrosomonas halophila]HRQ05145.1 SRPBCC family protein [Nitrosomonas halophila]
MFNLFNDTPVVGKASTEILCPTDIVFSFIGANLLTNYPRWSPEVRELEKLTEGDVAQGSLFRQVRVDQGNRSESTFKVTAFKPVTRICFEGVSNPYRCDYVLEVVDANTTRLSFTFELLKLEMHMRPFEKLICFAVQDGTERTVRNIRKLVESEADLAGALV